MKLPLNIAEKLLQLVNGERIAASKMKHKVIDELIGEGIIKDIRQGRTKSSLQLANAVHLAAYLQNHYGINNISAYVQICMTEDAGRAEAVLVSSNSKLKSVRTFKGFLVNTFYPVNAMLNGEPIIIQPHIGTFTFVFDYETFIPASNITIVGIENAENFRFIEKQKHLFTHLNVLFVSRYPYSYDLIKWLQVIPNNYIHFGDFDFAGIGIFLNEFHKYLKNKSSFYLPNNIEFLIEKFGNKNRYNEQRINFDITKITDDKLLQLIALIHLYKKGLDQELFLNEDL